MQDNLKGAFLMMGAMATFTMNDAALKWLAEDLPAFQVTFLRGCVATTLIVLLSWAMGTLGRGIARADRPWAFGRSAAETAAFLPFLLALQNMPLANITAILAALPLSITAAGALFLGERVGWRRWTAIGVGLVGVLLIVRPGTEGFNAWSAVAMITVLLATARDLLTRRLSRDTPSLNVAAITAAMVTLLGLALSLAEPWGRPTAGQGGMILAAAGFIFAAYLCSVMAMRVGEVGAVTPFRYTSLVWALILGWLVFGDWPATLTLIGAALIAATGLYTLWREGRVAPMPRATGPR
ncbi:DMT family transporter [Jannaschia sp. KMU-145]|uniref:DMT family transporter n=1 Tax=Jannaschia halovivens TaxID=3388667 RepID=UPI00396B023A